MIIEIILVIKATVDMKEIIYYDEMCVPRQVRLVSDMLCLDHTFSANATTNCIGYDEMILLAQSKLIDRLYVDFDEGSAAIADMEGKLFYLQGWYQINLDEIQLKKISEYRCYDYKQQDRQKQKRGFNGRIVVE